MNRLKCDNVMRRCADPTELGTYMSGVNCEECKVGTLLPKNPLDYNSEWQCVDCQSVVFSKVIEMKIKTFEDQIDDIKGDDAESYEKLLRKMRYHLHENHYWILDVKRRLIDIYGNKEGYQLHTLPQVGLSFSTIAIYYKLATLLGDIQHFFSGTAGQKKRVL